MHQSSFQFEGGKGQTLAGVIEHPVGKASAWAIFAHCFTCTRDSLGAVAISRALARQGIGVLRFDFTGLGESEGDFGADGISGDIADLEAAVQAMENAGHPVSLLVGHSLGGAAVLHAAGGLDSVKAVVTVGAPADPAHVLKLLGEDRQRVEEDGRAEVSIGGRPFCVSKDLIHSMENQPWQERIAGLRRPLLIMHSPLDRIVSVDNAADIFAAAKHPKSFVSLDQADHLLTKRDDANWAAEVIASWADRYLLSDTSTNTEDESEGVITTTAGNGFLTEVVARRHHSLADEPKRVGGSDLGPTPYDLLGAALGSCTGMTLGMYARHKDLDLEEVQVRVRHDRIHATDCENCESKEGKVDRFTRLVSIKGELTAEERQRLLEIADRCPVHRTLENEISIETRLADSPSSDS